MTSQPAILAPIRMIPLRVGDRVAERLYQNDRIQWKLPARRLERFRAAGVVIDEERRITSLFEANVLRADSSGAVLRVRSRVTSIDVPRDQLTATSATFDLQVAPDNQPLPNQELSIADAAMVGLPFTATAPSRSRSSRASSSTLRSGSSREPVTATSGSMNPPT